MNTIIYFNALPVFVQYICVTALFLGLLYFFRYFSAVLRNISVKFQKLINSSWIQIMDRYKVFRSFYFMLMTLILASCADLILETLNLPNETVNSLFGRVLQAFAVVSVSVFLSGVISVTAERFERKINLPVKGLSQAFKILVWVITLILAISSLIDKDPSYLIGGLTALSAVLLLIFQSAILGLVSGFQLVLNDLVRVGDWIVIPSQNADGEIIDILLTTVRVRNWDNTIVNIPANSFISTSFTNWRGMSESGGRRIKRAINIDMKSIRFLDNNDIEKLRGLNLLNDYLTRKKSEIEEINKESDSLNAYRLTNVGTFRAYCLEYLRQNKNISNKFTCMVRQLSPTTEGLPLEIYCFCNNTAWVFYEGVQSDIFDHLLAILPIFDLKVYQKYSMD